MQTYSTSLRQGQIHFTQGQTSFSISIKSKSPISNLIKHLTQCNDFGFEQLLQFAEAKSLETFITDLKVLAVVSNHQLAPPSQQLDPDCAIALEILTLHVKYLFGQKVAQTLEQYDVNTANIINDVLSVLNLFDNELSHLKGAQRELCLTHALAERKNH